MVAKSPEDTNCEFLELCLPDILVALDIEAVEVVVRHVVAVTTFFEALNDGQLHTHGDVSWEHGKQQVLLGTGGQTDGRIGEDKQSIRMP